MLKRVKFGKFKTIQLQNGWAVIMNGCGHIIEIFQPEEEVSMALKQYLMVADDVGNIIWRVAPDTRAN